MKLREFSTTKPALKQVIKVLYIASKYKRKERKKTYKNKLKNNQENVNKNMCINN